MDWLSTHATPLIDSVVYSVLGIVILVVAFMAIRKLLPFSVRKEIEEDQNLALGVILAAVVLGIAIIIASVVG